MIFFNDKSFFKQYMLISTCLLSIFNAQPSPYVKKCFNFKTRQIATVCEMGLVAVILEGCEFPKRMGYHSPLLYHFLSLFQPKFLADNISQHFLLECTVMPNRRHQ